MTRKAATPAPERDLRERLREVLLADREPTDEEALLIGLLEPLGLIDSTVPRDQRKDARKRAEAVAEQDLTGMAVRGAIRAVQVAVIAAIAASTSATVVGSKLIAPSSPERVREACRIPVSHQ